VALISGCASASVASWEDTVFHFGYHSVSVCESPGDYKYRLISLSWGRGYSIDIANVFVVYRISVSILFYKYQVESGLLSHDILNIPLYLISIPATPNHNVNLEYNPIIQHPRHNRHSPLVYPIDPSNMAQLAPQEHRWTSCFDDVSLGML
jgi:hypothetical protein